MSKAELTFKDFVIKNRYKIFLSIVFLFGLYVRYLTLGYESPDYLRCLLPWYNQLGKNGGGFSSLKNQVGNYNVLYQFLICILTYLPLKPIHAYKFLSIIFDILLAYESSRIVLYYTNDELKSYISFAIVYLCPIVIMNSAVWGQCDSIFTYFILLTIRMLLEKKYNLAFVSFGLSFANKLQAIFIAPFLVYLYFVENKINLYHFAIAFVTFYATGLPSFIFGRRLLAPLDAYIYQANQYEGMALNTINFWTLCPGDYYDFSYMALSIALVILGIALLVLIEQKQNDLTKQYLKLATWSAWTCVLFLPTMHERYSYPSEMLLITLSVINKKYSKYTAVQFLCSCLTYCFYLYSVEIPALIQFAMAFLVMFSWLFFTIDVFEDGKNK